VPVRKVHKKRGGLFLFGKKSIVKIILIQLNPQVMALRCIHVYIFLHMYVYTCVHVYMYVHL